LKKAKELLAVIDAEASAKRITEPVAQGLRWSLRNLTAPGVQDSRSTLTTVNFPLEDEAISKAAREYQETANTVHAEVVELARLAGRAAEKRCADLVGNATTARDVDALQALLERLKTLATAQPYPLGTTLERCSNLMRSLRDSFELTPSSDPALVSKVLSGLTPMHNGVSDPGSDASFDKRVAIVLAPFKKSFEESQKELDSVLAERKSPERIYAALAALEDASSHLSAASNFRPAPSEANAPLHAYRTLAAVAAAMDSHQWFSARSQLNTARQAISQPASLASKRMALHAIFEKWEREIAENEAADSRQFRERLRQELGAVKQPSDLAPITKELANGRRDSEEGNNLQ